MGYKKYWKVTIKNYTDTGEEILTNGALYVRTPSAETVRISDPADWEALIDRCVQMRRDEFLRQLEDLLGRMGLVVVSVPERETVSPVWLEEIRHRATST